MIDSEAPLTLYRTGGSTVKSKPLPRSAVYRRMGSGSGLLARSRPSAPSLRTKSPTPHLLRDQIGAPEHPDPRDHHSRSTARIPTSPRRVARVGGDGRRGSSFEAMEGVAVLESFALSVGVMRNVDAKDFDLPPNWKV